MLAGVAKGIITPPLGVELCGFGVYLNRRATAIRDDLYVRALVLRDGAAAVAIASCDLIGIGAEITREVRERVFGQVDIPGDHILVCCSHTHHGPATARLLGWGEPAPDYVAALPERIAQVIVEAAGRLEPAELRHGRAPVAGIGYNRVDPGGLTDPEIRFLRVDRAGGVPLAVLFNHSAHAVALGCDNTAVSADWPGAAARRVEQRLGVEAALFLQGAAGDQNCVGVLFWTDPEESERELERAGAIAEAVIANAWDAARPVSGDDIRGQTTQVGLPTEALSRDQVREWVGERIELMAPYVSQREVLERYRRALEEHFLGLAATPGGTRCLQPGLIASSGGHGGPPLRDLLDPDATPAEIQVLAVGETSILAFPAELFVTYLHRLRRALANGPHLYVGYANDLVGYIARPEDYANGTYETLWAPALYGRFRFRPDVGETLAAALLEAERTLRK